MEAPSYNLIVGMMKEIDKVYPKTLSLAEWCGIPVFTDPMMPKDVIELRDAHGRVLSSFDWPVDKR